MPLLEIEQQTATLTRVEKLELIKYLTEDLLKDERLPYFSPGDQQAVWSPCDEFAAAEKLRELLEKTS